MPSTLLQIWCQREVHAEDNRIRQQQQGREKVMKLSLSDWYSDLGLPIRRITITKTRDCGPDELSMREFHSESKSHASR